MICNVADYLNRAVAMYPDKVAFVDEHRSLTFAQLQEESSHVAMGLISLGKRKQPVIIFLEKSVECISAFLGTVKSGNFYSPIDTNMPASRIEKIMNTLNPCAIITNRKNVSVAREFANSCEILIYEDLMDICIDKKMISNCSELILDSDLLYVLFTSGSTGVPKGVMISERGVIDFTEWATEYFSIDETYVFGNQTPFYFSFSIYEIYLTIKNGATTYIIPHDLFSYPGELMQYLYDRDINTIIWVPSALCMVSAFRALESPYLPKLKNVWFGAEVMPAKQLNRWRKSYPNVNYYNLYGPTEVTDTCMAYKVDREIQDTEMLPIGVACRNKEILLLTENDELAQKDDIGEICVRGSGLAYGYYNDLVRTGEVFVQNPLNTVYNEIIYHTGDLAKYNEKGEIVYVSRKDFQIKHMGQRIELGEIETAISAIEEIQLCCCLYDKKRSRILAFYTGNIDGIQLIEQLKTVLPEYMVPNKTRKMDEMPFNLNGKIDRQKLKELI